MSDAAAQLAWRERLVEAGLPVSEVIDRFYFRAMYFREPGGVLFEISTNGPGFVPMRTPRISAKRCRCRRFSKVSAQPSNHG